MAFAMRIVRRIHQHVVADQIDDCVCQPGALRDFDALEIAPASNVLTRLMCELRYRGFDRLGVFVEPRHPERQPSMPGLQRANSQSRMTVHHPASDERCHIAHTAPGMSCRALKPEIVPGVLAARC